MIKPRSIFPFLVAGVLISLIMTDNSFSQPRSKLGGLPGSATRMGYGAFGIGMGNAVSALVSKDIVGYYNPSLTPYQNNPSVSATVGFLSLDRNLNTLHYGQRLKPQAGLFVGILNAGVGDIQGRDINGRKTDNLSTSENVFFLSFGLRIGQKLSLGVTPKIFYYSLYTDVSSTTAGIDFGALYRFSDQISVAYVLQDLGSKYRWDTSQLYGVQGNVREEEFPVRNRIAAGYSNEELGLKAGLEFELIDTVPLMRAGVNVRLVDQFQIRGGIDQIYFSGDIPPRPSLGFSAQSTFTSWTPVLSYVYVIEPFAPSGIHMISLSVQFE